MFFNGKKNIVQSITKILLNIVQSFTCKGSQDLWKLLGSGRGTEYKCHTPWLADGEDF